VGEFHKSPGQIIRRVFNAVLNAIRVSDVSTIIDFEWDEFTVDDSDPVKDVYNYTLDSVAAGSIEITYEDTCKDKVVGASRL